MEFRLPYEINENEEMETLTVTVPKRLKVNFEEMAAQSEQSVSNLVTGLFEDYVEYVVNNGDYLLYGEREVPQKKAAAVRSSSTKKI